MGSQAGFSEAILRRAAGKPPWRCSLSLWSGAVAGRRHRGRGALAAGTLLGAPGATPHAHTLLWHLILIHTLSYLELSILQMKTNYKSQA